MAKKASNRFMYKLLYAYFNGATIKAIAIASNGAWDPGATDYDTLDDISTELGSHEFDGANYSRPTLTIVDPTESDANDNVVVDADDVVISSMGAGTNGIEGWLIYKDGATDADREIIAWYPYSSEQNGNGSDFTLQFDASGILIMAQAA